MMETNALVGALLRQHFDRYVNGDVLWVIFWNRFCRACQLRSGEAFNLISLNGEESPGPLWDTLVIGTEKVMVEANKDRSKLLITYLSSGKQFEFDPRRNPYESDDPRAEIKRAIMASRV